MKFEIYVHKDDLRMLDAYLKGPARFRQIVLTDFVKSVVSGHWTMMPLCVTPLGETILSEYRERLSNPGIDKQQEESDLQYLRRFADNNGVATIPVDVWKRLWDNKYVGIEQEEGKAFPSLVITEKGYNLLKAESDCKHTQKNSKFAEFFGAKRPVVHEEKKALDDSVIKEMRGIPLELKYKEFSEMNLERCESPQGFNHKIADWSLSDWFTAVMGELGEAANIAKKLNRYRDGVAGNTETEEELTNKLRRELGDTGVYLDLLCQRVGFNLFDAMQEVFESKNLQIGYKQTKDKCLRCGSERRQSNGNCRDCGEATYPDGRDEINVSLALYHKHEVEKGRRCGLCGANWAESEWAAGCPECHAHV